MGWRRYDDSAALDAEVAHLDCVCTTSLHHIDVLSDPVQCQCGGSQQPAQCLGRVPGRHTLATHCPVLSCNGKNFHTQAGILIKFVKQIVEVTILGEIISKI